MEENDQGEKGVQNVCFRWVLQYNLSVQKSMVVTDLKGVEVSSTLVTYVFHPT